MSINESKKIKSIRSSITGLKSVKKVSFPEIIKRIRKILDNIELVCNEEEKKKLWLLAIQLIESIVLMTPSKLDDVISKPVIEILRKRLDI